MSKRATRLPGTAYEVDFYKDYSAITYLLRKDGGEGSLKTINLPDWIVKAIRHQVEISFRCGVEHAQQAVREVIGAKKAK